MATATYPGGSSSIVNKTNADKFIPEIWSDEIIASYKKALVMANQDDIMLAYSEGRVR